MSKTEAQQVFDIVLTLQYNEVVELTFPLDTAAESFRSALYRERKIWAKSTGSKDQIVINRNYKGFPFKLEVSKVPGIMGAVIKKANGSTTNFTFEEKIEPLVVTNTVTSSTEIEHQKNLMREDGITEEEIDKYFKDDTK